VSTQSNHHPPPSRRACTFSHRSRPLLPSRCTRTPPSCPRLLCSCSRATRAGEGHLQGSRAGYGLIGYGDLPLRRPSTPCASAGAGPRARSAVRARRGHHF
jgi:hypothetical protein